MTKWLNSLQPYGALFLRLVLGAAMLFYGWDKVIPANPLHTHNYLSALHHHAAYVASLGLPDWLGYINWPKSCVNHSLWCVAS